jgi:hypothetical protein
VDLSRNELQRLARLGAKARLEELSQEESAIRQAFPDLFRARGRQGAVAAVNMDGNGRGRRRRRRGMSAAARKAVSERMKKYWANRRKAKGK